MPHVIYFLHHVTLFSQCSGIPGSPKQTLQRGTVVMKGVFACKKMREQETRERERVSECEKEKERDQGWMGYQKAFVI